MRKIPRRLRQALSTTATSKFANWVAQILAKKPLFRAKVRLIEGKKMAATVSVLYSVPGTLAPTLGEVLLSYNTGLQVSIDSTKEIGQACLAKADWFSQNHDELWFEKKLVFITVIKRNGIKRRATEEETDELFDALLEKLLNEIYVIAILSGKRTKKCFSP